MDYLLYASNEMFSSTTLIRQSKQIFDKLNTHEIEKAVILRDGKPSFIMLDFESYEKMMAEYIAFKKNKIQIKNHTNPQTIVQLNEEVFEENDISKEEIEKNLNKVPKSSLDENDEEHKEHTTAEIKEFWN